MSAEKYYTLVASLPALPYFKRAERLPINRQRLEERLRLLSDEDATMLAEARAVVEWGAQTSDRTDAQFVRRYEQFHASCSSLSLCSTLRYRINVRTLIAALRRRHRGEEHKAATAPWGAGDWVAHIEANWRSPDFKLDHVYPWIPIARQHLEEGRSGALEELLMDLIWQDLCRFEPGTEFQFATVISFVFKWDILERWLSYGTGSAGSRFSELAAGILASPPTISA